LAPFSMELTERLFYVLSRCIPDTFTILKLQYCKPGTNSFRFYDTQIAILQAWHQ
jgi:hypothetical protein